MSDINNNKRRGNKLHGMVLHYGHFWSLLLPVVNKQSPRSGSQSGTGGDWLGFWCVTLMARESASHPI